MRLKPLLVLFVACSLASTAFAGSYHDAATVYGAAEQHDDLYDGNVLWMEFDDPQGVPHYGTAVMLNERFGLTSAHIFTVGGFSFSNHLLGDGENYLTDPGQTYHIADFGTHPTWTGTFPFPGGAFMSEIDLAWFKLDSPIIGAGVDLGIAELGDLTTVPEFGRPATPGGFLPVDGERRAFDAPIDGFGAPGVFSSAYLTSDFLPLFFRDLPLAGMSTPGTSGSPWFNEFGQVVGINSGGAGAPFHGGVSGAVDLEPHFDWITANTTIPEPATLSLLFFGVAIASRRRR